MAKSEVSSHRANVHHTVLGNTHRPRFPIGGKIRPGIMVLTRAASERPDVVAIYDRGIEKDMTFEQIGKLITKQFPEFNDKPPLVPRNVPYFTVRPSDFSNPEISDQILSAYGEDRGDGVRRLYRFPVLFPSDSWEAVMPHDLVAWRRDERQYWSAYSPDGRTRHCMMYAPIKLEGKGGRPYRPFNGRPTQLRPENDGICDPELCPQFQSRECNLSGRFIFFIPGIKSVEAFELPTNSFYAMSNAIQRFEAVAFMRGGRLAGYLDNQGTPFYISKKLTEVTRLDDKGRSTRVAQWLIHLDAPVDLCALFAPENEDTLRLADAAANTLSGGGQEIGADPDDVIVDDRDQATSTRHPKRESDVGAVEQAEDGVDDHGASPPAPADTAPPRHNTSGQRSTAQQNEEIVQIGDWLITYDIDADQFDQYTNLRWGSGWLKNASGRKQVLNELVRYQNDPQGLRDKIQAVIDAHHRNGGQ